MQVVFLGSSFAQKDDRSAEPPTALQCFQETTLLDHWWRRLAAAGCASPSSVYVATNAYYYKYFEVWAFSKGIELRHIVNSGRSLGDNRVDWHTLALVLRQIARSSSDADVLVIGGDSLPPPGWDLASFLAASHSAPESSLLLQQVRGPPPTGGPRIRAFYMGAEGAPQRVLSVQPSAGRAAVVADVKASPSPLLYFIKGADAARLLQPDAVDTILLRLGVLTTGESAGVASESLIPVEAAAGLLATEGRLTGHVIGEAFLVGAADGRPQGIPAGDHAPSPFAHHLPATLAYAAKGVSTVPGGWAPGVIHARSYARVGLMGNPSDGYGGKTLSVTISNFRADAWLTPNADAADSRVTLLPHPFYDPMSFGSIGHVSTLAAREGYSGGVRLMMAALHRFAALAKSRGVVLHGTGFTLRYHTTVPRQVGLAGSSAILTAFIRALLRHYGYEEEAAASSALGLGRDEFPNFVLSVEAEELGITAGLQDRVVQAYEGAVHMDFEPVASKAVGHGAYTRIPVSALPPLFLAYAADPSDSGRIHAPVKQRWLAGDAVVIAGMTTIANLADSARDVCTATPYGAATSAGGKEEVGHAWAGLMAANFNARRALFGDPALGADNIRMIEIARECGASGKFPGSGGAILGVVDVQGMAAAGKLGGVVALPSADASPAAHAAAADARANAATEVLRAAYNAEGFVFVRLQPQEAPATGAGRVVD